MHEPSYCADDDGAAYPATTDALTAKHGTNTAVLRRRQRHGERWRASGVFGAAPGAKLLYYSGHDQSADGRPGGSSTAAATPSTAASLITTIDAVNAAIDDGADIISISLALGGDQDWIPTIAARRPGRAS